MTPEPVTDAALAADLAEEAGKLLLAVRERVGFDHPWLLGDEGDSQANALLLERLHAERPGDAVLSEEAYDDLNRLRADRVWIVDPLDGTREFSWEGRDDWAVHVALWQRHGGPNGAITDAAVALPAMGEVHRSDTVSAPADNAFRADPDHRKLQPAARRAVLPGPTARRRIRPDRFGRSESHVGGARRRRRLHPRRRPVGVGLGRSGGRDPGGGHARVAAGRLAR